MHHVLLLLAIIVSFGVGHQINSPRGEPDNFGLVGKVVVAAINATLNKWIPVFGEFNEGRFHTETDELEFGRLNLTLKDVTIAGINTTVAKIIRVHLIPLRVENITVHLDQIHFTSQDYELQGYFNLPTGKTVPLYGSNGTFQFSFHDVTVSAYMVPKINATDIWMQEFILQISTGGMNFNAENLMGGSALGRSFNTVMQDTGHSLFDHYKGQVIERYGFKIGYFIVVIVCVIFRFVCAIVGIIQKVVRGLWVYRNELLAGKS